MTNLETKQKNLIDKFCKNKNMVRGTISSLCTRCNRANCICTNKTISVAYRLTYKTSNQQSKIVYISKKNLPRVKKMISNYKKNKEILDQLIDLNVAMFKEGLI